MVMSYLITSNADYHERINQVEEKIDKLLDKIQILEYNISVISTALNKDLDSIADIVRSLK
jgi:Na+/phosphate symporter|tara:strand:+ start:269 stop:451 length:183 start_codon:yes stop_codon:yes gene_type:complete